MSQELAQFCKGVSGALQDHRTLLDGPVGSAGRKSFMDSMGAVNDQSRTRVYSGLCGEKAAVGKAELRDVAGLTLEYLDHSIAHGRRPDGLFHAYNLIHLDAEGFNELCRQRRRKVVARDSLKAVYGLSPLQLQEQWKAWVLATYPTR